MGISFAADSAGTVWNGDKIVSMNKLFALSKFAPVWIAIYQNAHLMGVPLETIIKEYRKVLWRNKFDTIPEYSKNFSEYLQDVTYITTNSEVVTIKSILSWLFNTIYSQIEKDLTTYIKENWQVNDFQQVALELLGTQKEQQDAYISSNVSRFDRSIISDELIDEILSDELIDYTGMRNERFSELMWNASFLEVIDWMIKSYLLNFDNYSNQYTWIIVYWFGEAEIFPSVKHFTYYFRYKGRNISFEDETKCIDENNSSFILPFADKSIVEQMIYGIHPNIDRKIVGFFTDSVAKTKEKWYSDDEIKWWYDDFNGKILSEAWNIFFPIKNAINHLSLTELSSLAEALVNLTIVQKRVSMWVIESVGWPIDLSVISKGDWFIWIKRKQYFESSLNPDFFNRNSNYEQE